MKRNEIIKKEFTDERGFSIYLNDQNFKNIHIVSMNPCTTRGGHTHDYDEIICILGGKGKAEIELVDSKGQRKLLCDKEYMVVTVKAGVMHRVYNVGDEVFYLVCFSRMSKQEEKNNELKEKMGSGLGL